MVGKVFKRRLVHGVALLIMALYRFKKVLLLVYVLKYKADLNANIKYLHSILVLDGRTYKHFFEDENFRELANL